MKVKTLTKLIVLSILSLMIFTTSVSAATTTLFRHSASTYVTSYHPDDYFSDYYKGIASVRGADRTVSGSATYSFAWTRITYDVQGSVSSETAYSSSSTDSTTRKKTLEVYDQWDTGSETRAYYNYGLRYVSNMR